MMTTRYPRNTTVLKNVVSKTWPFLCFSLSRFSGSCGFLILPAAYIQSSPTTRPLSHVTVTSKNGPPAPLGLSLTRWQRTIHSDSPSSPSSGASSSRDMTPRDAFAEESSSPSTSIEFAMDPYSIEARSITESLGISLEKHKQLCKHAELVVGWNDRLNLISRKDCNVNVVFGRHILPSLALVALPDFPLEVNHDADNDDDDDDDGEEIQQSPKARIVDVGTGGGFPGVPLAILYPESEFLLVDSVGKKLKAIEEMAKELGLDNIKTHHGRAEEIVDDPLNGRKYKNSFDICVGRSVTAMPRFCFWIQDLLKKDRKQDNGISRGGGRLVYIIGGNVEESVTSRLVADIHIDDLLGCKGVSDKRAVVLRASDVVKVAKESGEKKQVKGPAKNASNRGKMTTAAERSNASKGAWAKRDNSVKKQRGYENFKRFGTD